MGLETELTSWIDVVSTICSEILPNKAELSIPKVKIKSQYQWNTGFDCMYLARKVEVHYNNRRILMSFWGNHLEEQRFTKAVQWKTTYNKNKASFLNLIYLWLKQLTPICMVQLLLTVLRSGMFWLELIVSVTIYCKCSIQHKLSFCYFNILYISYAVLAKIGIYIVGVAYL